MVSADDFSWPIFNRACLIQPLDSATNTAVGKFEKLSIDLIEATINLNKSGSHLKVFQISYRSRDTFYKQFFCKYKLYGTVVSLPRSVKNKTQSITCLCEKNDQAGQGVN